MPYLYIISGCNGAGKTTASFTVLPEMLNCREFVNADEIARGLSPFQPEKVSFEAGRIMLNRLRELISQRVDFAFETTLATKSYRSLLLDAKSKGYTVVMIFFWLQNSILAKERVRERVENGGHNIPNDVIERRYERGLINFFSIYTSICSSWVIYNNSSSVSSMIAKFDENGLSIKNADLWGNLLKKYGR